MRVYRQRQRRDVVPTGRRLTPGDVRLLRGQLCIPADTHHTTSEGPCAATMTPPAPQHRAALHRETSQTASSP
ncbi:MAG: hypothetical protein MUD01_00575 [Chloroflexaceae bacterium]|nr:hypothetical protein [Chloroflexaceae bacterium]